MGLLSVVGHPLAWRSSLEWVEYVREHGVLQFLATYRRVKDRRGDVLKWGDEIEYHLVRLSPATGECALALVGPEVLAELRAADAAAAHGVLSNWQPEYGSWMVEATPGVPYGGSLGDLLAVERNMAVRRFRIGAARCLPPGTLPFTLVAFPLLGAGRACTWPRRAPGGPFSASAYVPDAAISPHPRFGALTANIRARRGRKVDIQVPLFADERTPRGPDGRPAAVTVETDARLVGGSLRAAAQGADGAPPSAWADGETEATRFVDAAAAAAAAAGFAAADSVGPAHVAAPGAVHLDAMAFGMGCCCLQVTFQARDIDESRFMYDQLAVLSPLMLALTANAPIWRGRLADTDTRWAAISASVDSRTRVEAGAAARDDAAARPPWAAERFAGRAAGGGERRIAKSRYSSVDAYIAVHPELDGDGGAPGGDARVVGAREAALNDVPLAFDAAAADTLTAAGLDARLARHVAHLFVRDPLVIFSERTDHVDDAASVEHFENVQSTNWRSVRWKPPPPDDPAGGSPSVGWRVELRTMEVQLTDYENAAFTVFVVLLSRALLFFDVPLYMPLSLVDANFERANARGAAAAGRFWFRARLSPLQRHCEPCAAAAAGAGAGAGASAGGGAGGPVPPGVAEMALAEILLGRAALEALERSGAPESASAANATASAPATAPAPAAPAPAPAPACATACPLDFPGLVPLIYVYLELISADDATRALVDGYLRLVVGRAMGSVMTGAAWQRAFVRAHPAYEADGVVPPEVATALLCRIADVAAGRAPAPELLGRGASPPIVFRGDEPEVTPRPRAPAGAAGAAGAAAAGGGAHGAAEPPALPAAPRAPGAATRMRGSSFSAEVTSAAFGCAAVQELIKTTAARVGLQLGLAAGQAVTPEAVRLARLSSPSLQGLRWGSDPPPL